MLLPFCQPQVETMYQTYDWKAIWNNICFKCINMHNRSIVYKFLHEILPNKKKLAQFYNSNPNCVTCNLEESNIHMFLYCANVQVCKNLLIKIIFYFCNMNVENYLLKCLFFDFPKVNKQIKNTLIIIVSSYIANIWFNRNSLENLDYKLKAKIKMCQKLHMDILQDKGENVFTGNYCKMDADIIDRL